MIVVETGRLRLRHMGEDDGAFMLALLNSTEARMNAPVFALRELGCRSTQDFVNEARQVDHGQHARRFGVPYLITPHGMLDPWSLTLFWVGCGLTVGALVVFVVMSKMGLNGPRPGD